MGRAVAGGYIQVTNGTDEAIVGRFDGKDYEFLPGDPTIVTQIVAAHILGFGVPDKTRVLLQLGWMRYSDEKAAAMKRLSQVKFESVELIGRLADEDQGELPSEQLAPDPSSTSRPSNAAGGEEGQATLPSLSPSPTEDDVV